jgi:hypothetical protein
VTRRTTPELRNEVVKLRKLGYSYSEIREYVPLAKSTLSNLLKDIKLSKKAREIIESKTVGAQKLGAEAKRKQRIEKVERIRKSAFSQITNITDKELFLMGIMLYWAEGSKAKEGNISQQVAFGNSDPKMCKFYLKWLRNGLKIKDEDIYFSVYINSIFKGKEKWVLNFWSEYMGVSSVRFKKVSFTKTPFSKKNKRENRSGYRGLLRIRVSRSTDLNRRIEAWIEKVCLQSGAII